jgi:DNA-binding response OmpR family regulator
MVWEGNFIIDRVVDSVVSRLRRKLGQMEDGRKRIKTVHGIGYSMADCTDGSQ